MVSRRYHHSYSFLPPPYYQRYTGRTLQLVRDMGHAITEMSKTRVFELGV